MSAASTRSSESQPFGRGRARSTTAQTCPPHQGGRPAHETPKCPESAQTPRPSQQTPSDSLELCGCSGPLRVREHRLCRIRTPPQGPTAPPTELDGYIDRTRWLYRPNSANTAQTGRAGKPALSRTLAQFERRLGTRLLERDTKAMGTIAAGSRFLPHARHISRFSDAAGRVWAELARHPLVINRVTGTTQPSLWEPAPQHVTYCANYNQWLVYVASDRGIGVVPALAARLSPHPGIEYHPIPQAPGIKVRLVLREQDQRPAASRLRNGRRRCQPATDRRSPVYSTLTRQTRVRPAVCGGRASCLFNTHAANPRQARVTSALGTCPSATVTCNSTQLTSRLIRSR